MSDDWSPLLRDASAHLGASVYLGTLRRDTATALGWMAALLTPRVEAAFSADTPDVLDAAVDAVLREELPAALGPFAPVLRVALLSGAAALWWHLSARKIDAEQVRIVDVE